MIGGNPDRTIGRLDNAANTIGDQAVFTLELLPALAVVPQRAKLPGSYPKIPFTRGEYRFDDTEGGICRQGKNIPTLAVAESHDVAADPDFSVSGFAEADKLADGFRALRGGQQLRGIVVRFVLKRPARLMMMYPGPIMVL